MTQLFYTEDTLSIWYVQKMKFLSRNPEFQN